MKKRDNQAVSPVIGVILMIAITVILAAVVYLWVIGFFGAKAAAPTVSLSSTLSADEKKYIVTVSASSRADITIAAVKIIVRNATTGATLIDTSLNEIYSQEKNNVTFMDDGDCFLNAGDSFHLKRPTYGEGDKMVLVYIPSGGTTASISLHD